MHKLFFKLKYLVLILFFLEVDTLHSQSNFTPYPFEKEQIKKEAAIYDSSKTSRNENSDLNVVNKVSTNDNLSEKSNEGDGFWDKTWRWLRKYRSAFVLIPAILGIFTFRNEEFEESENQS